MKIGGSVAEILVESFEFQISGDDRRSMIKSKVSVACNFPTDEI